MEKVMKPPLSSKQRSEVACTKRSAVVPERGSEGPPLLRAAFRGRKPDEDTWSGASCLDPWRPQAIAAGVREERKRKRKK
jgi:hypothetical protein